MKHTPPIQTWLESLLGKLESGYDLTYGGHICRADLAYDLGFIHGASAGHDKFFMSGMPPRHHLDSAREAIEEDRFDDAADQVRLLIQLMNETEQAA